IEEGVETTRLKRERGWAYWHQLFNSRQLLMNGLFVKYIFENYKNLDEVESSALILILNKILNWNTKLNKWRDDETHPNDPLFYNQSFNTLYNYSGRSFTMLKNQFSKFNNNEIKNIENSQYIIKTKDARDNTEFC